LPSELPRHLQGLNHVAVTYATREAWQRQIGFLISKGMTPDRQVERGATYSAHLHDPDGNEIELLCERRREIWENDIDAAINHAVALPVDS
jgi:catechol 2,3-dioxygenase